MWQAWILCGIGIIFSLSGAGMFYRNIYEEEKKIWPALLVMIAGVLLIGLGTAKYFHLID